MRRVTAPDAGFSLVQDPPLRLQRLLRICPADRFGVVRRILLLVLITWVPIIVWAAVEGHLHPAVQGESLMRHLGVHVRCLVGIPLFLLSEPLADRVMRIITGNFVASGLIRADDRPAFDDVLRSVERLRDSRVAWLVILVTVVLTTLVVRRMGLSEDVDSVVWSADGTVDFGGTWALYVVRPLFLFMMLSWVWRLILSWILLRRIGQLDLQLVPSHPDHVGGIGFVALHSAAFCLVVLGISTVGCSAVAHQMLAHGVKFAQAQPVLISLVVLLSVLFVLPLTAFGAKLRRTSLRAQFEYGTLAGRHVRGLHQRWVEGRKLEDDILQAPEIGPAADVQTLYQMATKMQVVPIGKIQIATILLPALLPAVLVASVEVPVGEILLKVLKTLT